VKRVRLGDTAKFINGAAFKPSDWADDGLPIIRIQNLTGTGESFNRTNRVVRPELVVEPGDLLVSWSATLDAYRWTGPRGVLNQHIFKVLPNESVHPDYLYFALREVISELEQKTHGSTMKHVVRGDFESTEIPLPPLSEQERLVDLLSRAENIVRMRREAEQRAKEIIPALFLDMFGDPATNPKGWEVKRIDELTTVGTGGTPSRDKPEYYGGDIPWVKTGEVSGSVVTSTEEFITDLAIEETNCKKFPIGTILIAMYGQGRTRGRAAILGVEAATNQACAAILPSDKVETSFLYRLLVFQYYVLRAMGRGGNQANLNLSMIKTLRVPMPDRDLQRKFANLVASLEVVLDTSRLASIQAGLSFQSLLAGVFGE
jgi:type I restriction enzyme S subunit